MSAVIALSSGPSSATLALNGVAVQSWGANGPATTTRSAQWVTPANGTGGGNTTAVSFASPTSTPASLAGLLTYTPSAVNGDTWTIGQTGLWSIKALANVFAPGLMQAFITRNATSTIVPTPANVAAAPATFLDYNVGGSVSFSIGLISVGGTYALAAGDVIRIGIAQNNLATTTPGGGSNAGYAYFTFLGSTAASL